jgi:hypothetical protein
MQMPRGQQAAGHARPLPLNKWMGVSESVRLLTGDDDATAARHLKGINPGVTDLH